MEEREHQKGSGFERSFFIEAAIDERGPKELRIVPSYNQFLIYDDEEMLGCIQQDDDGEWEQVEGPFTKGIVTIIGKEILRTTQRFS